MGRAPCCEKVGLKRGRWTAEEDQILINYIHANGEGSWRSLPKNAGLLRCGKSCRLRWINYLRSDLKRGKFCPEEEEIIIKLHATLGNRWSLIAAQLPGRTDNEIKNYWNAHLSRKFQSFRRPESENSVTKSMMDLAEGAAEQKKRRGGKTSRSAMKKNKTIGYKHSSNINHVPKLSDLQPQKDTSLGTGPVSSNASVVKFPSTSPIVMEEDINNKINIPDASKGEIDSSSFVSMPGSEYFSLDDIMPILVEELDPGTILASLDGSRENTMKEFGAVNSIGKMVETSAQGFTPHDLVESGNSSINIYNGLARSDHHQLAAENSESMAKSSSLRGLGDHSNLAAGSQNISCDSDGNRNNLMMIDDGATGVLIDRDDWQCNWNSGNKLCNSQRLIQQNDNGIILSSSWPWDDTHDIAVDKDAMAVKLDDCENHNAIYTWLLS